MLRQFFTNSILILVVILSNALCLASSDTQAPEEKKLKGPIVITSETLSADNKARTALFKGSVVAKAKEMTIYSDEMLVYYAETTGNIKQIEAGGNVKLLKDNLVIGKSKLFC
jgi:lipopolysaccharide export system protein LptA